MKQNLVAVVTYFVVVPPINDANSSKNWSVSHQQRSRQPFTIRTVELEEPAVEEIENNHQTSTKKIVSTKI